jgi:hypothetical protein
MYTFLGINRKYLFGTNQNIWAFFFSVQSMYSMAQFLINSTNALRMHRMFILHNSVATIFIIFHALADFDILIKMRIK